MQIVLYLQEHWVVDIGILKNGVVARKLQILNLFWLKKDAQLIG